MGCAVIRTGNGHITHKVLIDETVLDRVAEALGIPQAERNRFISNTQAIYVYRGSFSASGAASAPAGSSSPGASPPSASPPGGGRR